MGGCLHCHAPLTSRRFYCGRACQGRAYRRRRAGVAQDAHPDGGLRGRVPLHAPTLRELADERARVLLPTL